MRKLKENSWLKLLFIGVVLILVYKSVDNLGGIVSFFGTLLGVISPCVIGALIALFVYVPTKKLERVVAKIKWTPIQKGARLISVLLIYAVLFALITFGVKYLIPVLYKNVEDLIVRIPVYTEKINALFAQVEFFPTLDVSFLGELLKKYFDPTRINAYISVISGIANSFISFVVSIIISIYIVLETENIKAYLEKLRGRMKSGKRADVFVCYTKKIIALFRSYFTGLFLDSLLIGTISTIVFMIFKVPYAAFLGVVIGIGNMVPFFGPIVAAIIVYLIGMISLGPLNALWLFVYQLILGQIDGNIIQPKIVGSQVGLKPLWVLVSVTIFGGLFGPAGMILGVPVFASAKLAMDDYLDDGRLNASSSDEKTE